ncbi:MAG: hypothetical protein IIY75_02330, partial [Erysipelotrichales bacterium]|nr:hypothetical protein [Erysipelotrichales bacterium]
MNGITNLPTGHPLQVYSLSCGKSRIIEDNRRSNHEQATHQQPDHSHCHDCHFQSGGFFDR